MDCVMCSDGMALMRWCDAELLLPHHSWLLSSNSLSQCFIPAICERLILDCYLKMTLPFIYIYRYIYLWQNKLVLITVILLYYSSDTVVPSSTFQFSLLKLLRQKNVQLVILGTCWLLFLSSKYNSLGK